MEIREGFAGAVCNTPLLRLAHLSRETGCEILGKMREIVKPGVTTAELNELARVELDKVGGVGLSKNYPTYKEGEGFPAESCISVNEEIAHGVPGSRKLNAGDAVRRDPRVLRL